MLDLSCELKRQSPMPRADTGSVFLDRLSDGLTLLLHLERRVDPWFRPNEGLKIAEEKPLPDEEAYLDSIISTFEQQMRKLWKAGGFERGGNTKTHGIVSGEFIVHDNLPPEFRRGIYAQPHTYRAWVRFSGPGPYITPDIDDVGFMSISIKLMGVPGELIDFTHFSFVGYGLPVAELEKKSPSASR